MEINCKCGRERANKEEKGQARKRKGQMRQRKGN